MNEPAKKYNISFDDLEKVVLIDGKPYYLCPQDNLEKLLADNTTLKAENATLKAENAEKTKDIEDLKSVVIDIIRVFGLLDEKTGTIKESIQNGEEGYFKYILKALNKIVLKVTMAQFSKADEKELIAMFAFITKIIPLINKYAGGNKPGEPKQLAGGK